jgi:hypothetical protein
MSRLCPRVPDIAGKHLPQSELARRNHIAPWARYQTRRTSLNWPDAWTAVRDTNQAKRRSRACLFYGLMLSWSSTLVTRGADQTIRLFPELSDVVSSSFA